MPKQGNIYGSEEVASDLNLNQQPYGVLQVFKFIFKIECVVCVVCVTSRTSPDLWKLLCHVISRSLSITTLKRNI